MKSLLFPSAVSLLLLSIPQAFSQELELPRTSPAASVIQDVGLTEISIDYHRPGVKGRVIWGKLVPWDTIWRTGANEATTINFSDDVKIAGKDLKRGEYSLFTIPGKEEWTIVFNANTELWGEMGYSEEQDVLRIQVKPETGPHTEWMQFTFEDLTSDSANLVFRWEKTKVAIPIKVEFVEKVLASAREAVATREEGDWRTPYGAADFCIENKVNLEEGFQWINAAVKVEKSLFTLNCQARYFAEQGDYKKAIETANEALRLGKEKYGDTGMVNRYMETITKRIEEWSKKAKS